MLNVVVDYFTLRRGSITFSLGRNEWRKNKICVSYIIFVTKLILIDKNSVQDSMIKHSIPTNILFANFRFTFVREVIEMESNVIY